MRVYGLFLKFIFVVVGPNLNVIPIDATSQVQWKNFKEKNGLFTIKYPSNWSPYKYIEDTSAPVNIYFAYAGTGSSFAELVLSGEESIYSNVTDPANSYPVYLESYPGYKVIQEAKCGKYTINNITACHMIVTYRNTDLEGRPLVYELVVGALDKGTEYILLYYVTADLYDYFLPVAERMISSFNVINITNGKY